MPTFTEQISVFRELLAEDMLRTMEELQAWLPADSPLQDELILLMARYSDIRKKERQQTEDDDFLLRLDNQLRRDILTFIQEIKESDFDPPSANSQKSTGQGELLYQIPHVMPLEQETRCLVRIALNKEALLQDFKPDAATEQRSLRKISKTMQVELNDPSGGQIFDIRTTSRAIQSIDIEGIDYTEWRFFVKPKKQGSFVLEIKVCVIELIEGEKILRERVLEETIDITAGTGASEPAFKTAGQVYAFVPADSTAGDFPEAEAPEAGRGIPDAAPEIIIPTPQAPLSPPPAAASAPPRPQFGGTLAKAEKVKEVEATVDLLPKTPAPRRSGRPLQITAVFLAVLMFGSVGTWAFTPAPTWDWWITSIKDSETAYTAYIEKHPKSNYREKAYFRRAELTENPLLVRAYLDSTEQRAAPNRRQIISAKLAALETREFEIVKRAPSPERIQNYTKLFPDTKRLIEIKNTVENDRQITVAQRQAAISHIEKAATERAVNNPTEDNVRVLLREFQESREAVQTARRITEIKPELKLKLKTEIEKADRLQRNKTVAPKDSVKVKSRTRIN